MLRIDRMEIVESSSTPLYCTKVMKQISVGIGLYCMVDRYD